MKAGEIQLCPKEFADIQRTLDDRIPMSTGAKRAERALPAISAVATVAAVAAAAAAAATTATAIPTSAAATATTVTASTTTAATGAFRLGTRFIDNEVPASEILSVQGSHGAIGFFIIGNFNEGETTRLSRETISNQADSRGIHTNLPKPFLQLLFRCGERKIPDVKLLHQRTPSARNLTTIAERTENTDSPKEATGLVPQRAGYGISGPVHGLQNESVLQQESTQGNTVLSTRPAREKALQAKL